MADTNQLKRDMNPSQVAGALMAAEFARHLTLMPDVMAYLAERGLDAEHVARFGLGFCPPYSSHWFPLLRGRVIVPIQDAHGQVVAFAGRKYEPMALFTERSFRDSYDHKPGEAQKRIDQWNRGKWINEPYQKSRHLFNLDRALASARERGYIVVVEGYMDALVLSANGLQNTVAVCGTRLSERHAALLARYCRRVIILLDGDSAGEDAQEHILPRLAQAGILPQVIMLPEGYDPDDFVLQGHKRVLYAALTRLIETNQAKIKLNQK